MDHTATHSRRVKCNCGQEDKQRRGLVAPTAACRVKELSDDLDCRLVRVDQRQENYVVCLQLGGNGAAVVTYAAVERTSQVVVRVQLCRKDKQGAPISAGKRGVNIGNHLGGGARVIHGWIGRIEQGCYSGPQHNPGPT